MSFSVSEHPIDNFKCYKDGNSIYFGEISQEKRNEESEETIPKRNGIGVQIFQKENGEISTRFEGNWKSDKKINEGTFLYPDGSKYNGQLKGNLPHGYGNFEWADGMKFNGNWLNGRMEGGGKFYHIDVQNYL